MKTVIITCCLVVFWGGWAASDAQMWQCGERLNLQGTCLAQDAPCNQREQWQYQLQTAGAGVHCGIRTVSLDTSLPLTGEEVQSLLFMREEEKLARDLYLLFYQRWATPVFANLALAEQQHMDTLWHLMQRYDLADSATATVGDFNNQALQELFNSLLARGSASQAEALGSGAFVEETDIEDLQQVLEMTANPALITVYGNLLGASEQHLRSLVDNLENLGFVYIAQVLTPKQVTEILSEENLHGGIAFGGGHQLLATDAHFTPIVTTDTGKRGNHLNITQHEHLNIGMIIAPDRRHQGQFADFVNIAAYTPEGFQEAFMFMQHEQYVWQAWNGDFASLVPAQARQQLRFEHRLTIFNGPLAAPGTFQIQVAYRLQDGTLVMCGAPIEFTVR